jgi:deazaflavin-dependent oxidoreductase (nitroreductase family)
MPKVVTQSLPGRSRPMLGFRHQPGRLALALFRMPLGAYRHQKGWLLGHTFVLLTHIGRRTGQSYETVAMVLRYRIEPCEVVVASAWGPETDWVKNIRAQPAVRIETGRESFEPEQRFLSAEESLSVIEGCLRQHPWRFRLIAWVLGWGDLRVEAYAQEVVRTRPFIAFRPAHMPASSATT